MRHHRMRKTLAVVVMSCFINGLIAQEQNEQLSRTISQLDSLFWEAYNSCDISKSETFFATDVEFYHDKSGMTLGAQTVNNNLKNNLCSNPDFRLRREAVKGTVHVFPMHNNGKIYGAIITGEHLFFVKEKGRNERADGHASFTHLWMLKDNVWKMSRILSYNHHPAVYINQRKEISLTTRNLNRLTGQYKAPRSGEILIRKTNTGLEMNFGKEKMFIYPETETLFFSKDRDLTFEFVLDAEQQPSKIIVREFGQAVEEIVFVNKK
jgi:hypothetical protein